MLKKLKEFAGEIFRYRTVLVDEAMRDEFIRDVNFINFIRLRTVIFFVAAMILFQLYSDFFLSDFWDNRQVSQFMVLDLIMGFLVLVLLGITNIRLPKKREDIRPWHSYVVYSYIFIQLLWATGVSTVEASAGDSLPTLLIVVFSLAVLFIMRGWPFFILLVINTIVLIVALRLTGNTTAEIVVGYSPQIVLFSVAWITNRVLFNTRMKSFYANKELEIARNSLDRTVQERTLELRNTNEKLIAEISERKRYEKNLELEKKKAEEADRLKSVFLANMSHEIRTPLNGILGFSDLLQNTNLTQEKKTRYFEIIQNNGQQLVKIIDDIMDISMIESNQLKMNKVSFRVSHIFPDAEIYFNNHKRIISKEHILIQYKGFEHNEEDQMQSDPSRVQQVLYNLMSNALKFTEKGVVQFGGKSEQGFALVYVQDSGIGIEPELCGTIFQRFWQGEESTSRTYGGTGLGLSISKGIIEMLGGMIWVDLSYKEGARFCFSLPTETLANRPLLHDRSTLKKILTTNDLIVTHEGKSDRSSLSYFILCNKTDVPMKNPEALERTPPELEPGIVIVDLPEDPETNIRICEKISHEFSRARLFSVYNPESDIAERLLSCGCTRVFTTPLNLQLLLHEIYETVAV